MHMGEPPYEIEELHHLREHFPVAYLDYVAAHASRLLQLKVHGTDYIPCGFFDMVTRKCRHHAVKPDICRGFEVGGDMCVQYRLDAGLSLPSN